MGCDCCAGYLRSFEMRIRESIPDKEMFLTASEEKLLEKKL